MKHLSIVAGSLNTAQAIKKQINDYVNVEIKLFAIEDGISQVITDDLVLLSSDLVYEDLVNLGCYDASRQVIIAKRTINYDAIDQIVSLPSGTKVLLVNDLKSTALDVKTSLNDLGLNHLDYQVYAPDSEHLACDCTIAITPGEPDKVPGCVEMIVDIGPRLIDFSTLAKVLMALDVLSDKAGQFSAAYLHKIINISKRLAHARQEVDTLNTQLTRLIDALDEGLVVYDDMGRIKVVNDYACKLLGLRPHHLKNKTVKDIIYNEDLRTYAYDHRANHVIVVNLGDQAHAISKIKTLKNEYVLSIKKDETIAEAHRAMQEDLARRGYMAKYTFENIIGTSKVMVNTKRIAKKLAKSDLSILLHGESGTGKELFASAIHRASDRQHGPFLAINFSALPDELIESELFGYEDGAFTGAKKGGKPGLFEQADGGTLFLDEIGDVSGKVQTRLLRVLQEGEIMRVGGNEIKRINVRVVAATNKDLKTMVDHAQFRQDLYYRLQMGYINLPALRHRTEDIKLLVDHHMGLWSVKNKGIDQSVLPVLQTHTWPGNVRELKNCMQYMLALSEENNLGVDDLPEYLKTKTLPDLDVKAETVLNEEDVFILRAVKLYNQRREAVGREKLAAYSMGTPYELTKYQMRNRLEALAAQGYLTLGKGKVGARLSQEGLLVINTIKTPL